jgi:hypothetical protein
MVRHGLATLVCASVTAAVACAVVSAGAAAPARADASPAVAGTALAAPPLAATALPARGIWATVTGPTIDTETWVDVGRGPDGALYAAGSFGATAGAGDIMVAKFSANDRASDHVLWTDVWHDPAEHLVDQASALAVDGSGALVVAGTSQSATNGLEWVVAKWTAAGAEAWQTVTPAHAGDHWFASASDVVCDAAGDVYVCGTAQTGTAHGTRVSSLVVRKLSGTDGHVVWTRAYAGTPHSANWGLRLALGTAGDLYCTGFGGSVHGDPDMLVCRLSTASGRLLWLSRLADAHHRKDEGVALALRGSHLWVTGFETTSAASRAAVLAKYTLGGRRLWLRTWLETPRTFEDPTGLTVDLRGNAVVVGDGFSNPATREHAFILHYDPSGRLTWQSIAYDPTSHKAAWYGVVGDGSGRIWTVGGVPSGSSTSLTVASYAANGADRWRSVWAGPDGLGASGNAICLANGGGVFVGGAVVTKAGRVDALAVKLTR